MAQTILLIAPTHEVRSLLRTVILEDSAGPSEPGAIAREIVEVATGAAGLACCRQAPPDCVLLDCSVPDMPIFDVLAAIARQCGHTGAPVPAAQTLPHGLLPLPVVLLADADTMALAREALHHGAQDYLAKEPLDPAALRQAVARSCDRAALQQQLARQFVALQQENHALQARATLLAAACDHTNVGLFVTDAAGRFVYVNQTYAQITGCQPDELIGQPFTMLLPPARRAAAIDIHATFMAGPQTTITSSDLQAYRRDGSQFDAYMTTECLVLGDDQRYLVTSVLDITTLRQTEQAFLESEERYRSVIETMGEGVVLRGADGLIITCNRSAERILGSSSSDLIGRISLGEGYLALSEDGAPLPLADFPGLVTLRNGEPQSHVVMGLQRPDGPVIWLLINTRPLLQPGATTPYAVVVSFADITERKQNEQHLHHLAFHDTLTGLPNRARFLERLRQVCAHAQNDPTYLFAVILFDLDHFKVINDSLGHPVGDQLLGTTAERINACIRAGDVVARIGGDEFAILLEDIGGIEEAILVAERIQEALAVPLKLSGYTVVASASIGIALSQPEHQPDPVTRPDDLLRDADAALYRAKAEGRARYAIFDAATRKQAVERLAIETELWQALERQELRLLYQPIINTTTGAIDSFEALLHWLHPQHGLIASDAFIRVAEESGVITSLGHWVLHEVCRQARTALSQVRSLNGAPLVSPVVINVNISAREFLHPALIDHIAQALAENHLAAHQLRLEISERIVMYPTEMLLPVITRLNDLGVQLCLDAFGRGYSSLWHIAHFPIPLLKIDRSFVQTMGRNTRSHAIVQAVISLAHTLGMQVVAVEVETAQQQAQLHTMGCDYLQGFLFARPVDAVAAGALLRGEVAPLAHWQNAAPYSR